MLERNSPKPLYQQLREILLEGIRTGQWKESERVPSENELSAIYGLSRMTARAVLTDLVKEGVLYRVQGKGTYVLHAPDSFHNTYPGIRKQLEQMNYETRTQIINLAEEICDPVVAEHLQIEEGSPVFKITRLRYIKEIPTSIHISYINIKHSNRLTPEVLENNQLAALLSDYYELHCSKMAETLESAAALKDDAKLLQIHEGHPVLLLEDVLYDELSKPYEYTKVIFCGDKIKLKFEYNESFQ